MVDNVAEWSHGEETGGRRAVYYPLIEFDAGGTKHRAKGGVGKRKPWATGDAVKLHYKRANPNHLLDFNWWQRLFYSGAFILLGGLSLAVALGWVR
ncbi:hypothetical protein FIU90_14720 [Erythrobacter sp. THAF29]|nr:hypothetical protein FIU90_14720 [Erythrobacter sp. THAF29]